MRPSFFQPKGMRRLYCRVAMSNSIIALFSCKETYSLPVVLVVLLAMAMYSCQDSGSSGEHQEGCALHVGTLTGVRAHVCVCVWLVGGGLFVGRGAGNDWRCHQ